MKKNNKKLFIIIGVVAVVIAIAIFLIVRANSNSTELSLTEKKWIEDNKKSMVDIYVMNELPIFTLSENDIFLSFLNYFEAETGLSLNKVSFKYLYKIVSSNLCGLSFSYKVV